MTLLEQKMSITGLWTILWKVPFVIYSAWQLKAYLGIYIIGPVQAYPGRVLQAGNTNQERNYEQCYKV